MFIRIFKKSRDFDLFSYTFSNWNAQFYWIDSFLLYLMWSYIGIISQFTEWWRFRVVNGRWNCYIQLLFVGDWLPFSSVAHNNHGSFIGNWLFTTCIVTWIGLNAHYFFQLLFFWIYCKCNGGLIDLISFIIIWTPSSVKFVWNSYICFTVKHIAIAKLNSNFHSTLPDTIFFQ